MASFPGSIASFTNVTSTTSTSSSSTAGVSHASITDQVNGEVVAIETNIGINAQGTDATIAAKLVRIDGQSSGTGYVPTTFQISGVALAGTSITLGSAQVACIGINQLSTDGAMVSDSNSLVPSQKAVVTYVASQSTNAGTVTNVSSVNAYIQVANPTTTPVLTLNVGTAASQVVAYNASGVIPNLPFAKIASTTLSSATSVSFSSLAAGARYKLILSFVQYGTIGVPVVTFNGDTAANYQWGTFQQLSGNSSNSQGSSSAHYIVIGQGTGAYLVAIGYPFFGEINFYGTGSYVNAYYSNNYYQSDDGSGICNSVGGGLYSGGSLSSVTVAPSAGSFTGIAALYQII